MLAANEKVLVGSLLSTVQRLNNLLNQDFGEYNTFINADGDLTNAFLYTKTTSGIAGTYIPDRNYWLSVSYDF